jgi:RHS repeat-associated protein
MGDANAANELTGNQYDKAGNLTADGTHTYKYDAWNRLVEVDQGSTVLAQYRYDGEGRRIERIVGTTAEHYFYAGSQVVETRCGSLTSDPSTLTPEHQYVWSARGVDVAILRDTCDANGDPIAADRVYFLTDANGNVTALVNADGTPVERYSYTAYGNVTVYDGNWQVRTGGSAHGNDRLFAGREYDTATGLYYNRARWYNPATGSFLTRDPTGYAAGDANLYRYVANNPLAFTDPTGLSGSGGSGGSGGSSGGVPAGPSGGSGTQVWDVWDMSTRKIELCAAEAPALPLGMGAHIARELGKAGANLAARQKVIRDAIELLRTMYGLSVTAERIAQLAATSANQMQEQVEKGWAPGTVKRVDKGNPDHNEQDHTHFKDGSALNRDGTWKHGGKPLTNAEKRWFEDNGWALPPAPRTGTSVSSQHVVA